MLPRTHVLYLDDPGGIDVRDLSLEPCCYRVYRASAVAEAVRAAAAGYFDLCLVARCAAEPEGVEFYRRIRALRPHTPVLFHHGGDCGACREYTSQTAAAGYLERPAELWEFEEAMAVLIRRAESERRDVIRASRHPRLRQVPAAARAVSAAA